MSPDENIFGIRDGMAAYTTFTLDHNIMCSAVNVSAIRCF